MTVGGRTLISLLLSPNSFRTATAVLKEGCRAAAAIRGMWHSMTAAVLCVIAHPYVDPLATVISTVTGSNWKLEPIKVSVSLPSDANARASEGRLDRR